MRQERGYQLRCGHGDRKPVSPAVNVECLVLFGVRCRADGITRLELDRSCTTASGRSQVRYNLCQRYLFDACAQFRQRLPVDMTRDAGNGQRSNAQALRDLASCTRGNGVQRSVGRPRPKPDQRRARV